MTALRTLTLHDGRTLAYAEFGDPEGAPVVHLHGAQSSRNEAAAFDELGLEHGVRVIAPDRPGCGGSSPHPGRSLVGYAEDLAALADALALPTFVVAGMSNGGAYALAAGHALGSRVRGVIMINSTTPVHDAAARRALRPAARLTYALLRVGRGPLSRLLVRPHRRPRRPAGPDAQLLADPQIAAHLLQNATNMLGPHAAGYLAEEMALAAAPWGFDHRAVDRPVAIFAGDRDAGTPYARVWADELPDAQLHLFAGGHLGYLAPAARADIVRTMAGLAHAAPAP